MFLQLQTQPATGFDYITLAMAIFGAVTGCAALAVRFASLLVTGPRLRVKNTYALHFGVERWFMSVEVANNVGRARDGR